MVMPYRPPDPRTLPTMRLLLARAVVLRNATDPPPRGQSAAQKRSNAKAKPAGMPEDWLGSVEEAKAKKQRRSRRGIPSLPIATAAELAKLSALGDLNRRCVECNQLMPPGIRVDALRCGKACNEQARRRRKRKRA